MEQTTTIRAIETHYKGYRFRSRLEARWAKYFDALSIDWEYEKEGYDLGAQGWYLPDFWLPQVQMWAEVKPTSFDTMALDRVSALVRQGKAPVLLLDGIPGIRSYTILLPDDTTYCPEAAWGKPRPCSLGRVFSREECAGCSHLKLSTVAESDWVLTGEYVRAEGRFYVALAPDEAAMFDDVRVAVAAARGARFEHGEPGVRT